MNLDEFISETLKSIFKGVKDAQSITAQTGGRINPVYNFSAPNSQKYVNIESRDDSTLISDVAFDIAVTASDKKGSELKGGIQVFSLQIGGKSEDEKLNETVSRIKFSISVALPSTIPYIPTK